MLKEKIKIPRKHPFRDFALIKTLSGTYVCPGWHPVPPDTTRDDIELIESEEYIEPITVTKEPEVIESAPLYFKAPSSKGDKTYNVSFIKGVWNCDCPATTFFKGPCKHIKKFKQELETK